MLSPRLRLALWFLPLGLMHPAEAQVAVSGVSVQQRPGSRVFDIDYTLSAPSTVNVGLEVSPDAGQNWGVPVMAVSGDYGPAISPSSTRRMTWNALLDWTGPASAALRFRVVANGLQGELAFIPAGAFLMGNEKVTVANAPVHQVELSSYSIGRHEVTKGLWDQVRPWAVANGYTDLPVGIGQAADHPVSEISWLHAVMWCNARSEQEGLEPAYYTDATLSTVYQAGDYLPENTFVKWDADGYRLPTEAEFEKAARGGTFELRYPWGDTISHAEANYDNNAGEPYSLGTTGRHPLFNSVSPNTNPVTFFPVNGYGVQGTQDNVWEWCWDRYAANYYEVSPLRDPRGPNTGSNRMHRGGSFFNNAQQATLADRRSSARDYSRTWSGFRIARRSTLGAQTVTAESADVDADLRPVAFLILNGLTQYYDGTPREVSAESLPSGRNVTFTYDGNESAPVEQGSYEVVATIDDEVYQGRVTDTLTVLRPRLAIEQPSLSALDPDAASVHLGAAKPGDTLTASVTLRNVGTGELDGLAVALTGDDAAHFAAETPALLSLEPDGSTTFLVSLVPPVAGRFEATLQVSSSDVSRPVFEVKLSGLGDLRLVKPILLPSSQATLPTTVAVPWNDAALGLYDGLLIDADDAHTLLGAIENVRVRPVPRASQQPGIVTGRVRFKGLNASFRGQLDVQGALQLNLPQGRGGAVLGINLQLHETTPAGYALRGEVTWQGVTATANLPRAPFHPRQQPAPAGWVGAFTVVLPSQPGSGQLLPGGDGWARVLVNAGGGVKVSGRLGDGTGFTESAHLSAQGTWAWFTELYRGNPRGHVGGTMAFRDVEAISDLDGPLQWVKPATPRAARYPAGFSLETWAVGSRFLATLNGQRVLAQLADEDPNASLSLIDPTLSTAVDGEVERVIGWLANNQLRYFGPDALKASADRRSGRLRGSFRAANSQGNAAFEGVVLQKQGLAAGLVTQSNRTGALRIQPGTDFPYPGSEDPGSPTLMDSPLTQAEPPEIEVSPLVRAAAGIYGGLLALEGNSSGGIENLKINANGSFSGHLWIYGLRYSVRGRFDIDGSAVAQIQRPGGLSPIAVTLQLHREEGSLGGYQLTGSVALVGQTHQLTAERRPLHSKREPSPHQGRYTLALLAPSATDSALEPAGDGYAALQVDHLGRCRGALVLPDQTQTTFAGHVSSAAEWSLHRSLYGRPARGFVAGKITFRQVAGVSDADGEWRWERQISALPRSLVYPAGFALTRRVVASRYAPVKGQSAWPGLAGDWFNIWVHLAGTDVAPAAGVASLTRVASWTPNNRIHYFGADALSITLNQRTGIVSGRYRSTVPRINQPFGGALLPIQSQVTGTYLTGPFSGRFSMEPRSP